MPVVPPPPPLVSFDCVDGVCEDPGDGSGFYPTFALCEAGCVPVDVPACLVPDASPYVYPPEKLRARLVDHVFASLPARWQCHFDGDNYGWVELANNACKTAAPTTPCNADAVNTIFTHQCPAEWLPVYDGPVGGCSYRNLDNAFARLVDFTRIIPHAETPALTDRRDVYKFNPQCCEYPFSYFDGMNVVPITKPEFVETDTFGAPGVSALLYLRVAATDACADLQCDEGPPPTFVGGFAVYDKDNRWWVGTVGNLHVKITVAAPKQLSVNLSGGCAAHVPEGGGPITLCDYPLRAEVFIVAGKDCCGCDHLVDGSEDPISQITLAIEGYCDRAHLARYVGRTMWNGVLTDVYEPMGDRCPPLPCQARSCCDDWAACTMVAELTALDSCTCFDGLSVDMAPADDPSGNAWQNNGVATCSNVANVKLICLCAGKRLANFWWNFDVLNCSGFHQLLATGVDCGGGGGRTFDVEGTATLTCGTGGCDGGLYPCACPAGTYRYQIRIRPKT